MVRVLAILSVIVALVAPHGVHSDGHGKALAHDHEKHSADDHMQHVADDSDQCEVSACGEELLMSCCDAMEGHCIVAVEAGWASAGVVVNAAAFPLKGPATEVLVGQTVAREPPPPRV